jgi:hypothetical protein
VAGDGRQLLTRKQEMLIRRLLAAGSTHAQAAAAAGISYRRLKTRLYDQLVDLRVGQGRGGGPNQFEDLAVEEIYARAAALRETWDEATLAERWNPAWRPNFADADEPGTL